MKVLDAIWFTHGLLTIGLVVGKDETTGEIKYYIGKANGFDEKADCNLIIASGTKVNADQVRNFLSRHEKEGK